MKNLKTYESYLSDKMKLIRDKFTKLKKILDFMNKYKLPFFVVAMETPNGDFMFEEIHKEGDNYYLLYEDYRDNSKQVSIELTQLDNDVVDELLDVCEKYYRFTIEYHLETGLSSDIENYIRVYKTHKEPIKFTQWMFSQLLEQELQDDANGYKFQDILFSTHPEAFDAFMDECIDSEKRSKGEFEPLKLHPKIKLKYKNLLDDYIIKQDGKKYNL